MEPMQAFLTGWLTSAVWKDGQGHMKVMDIKQGVDGKGNYLPYFDVHFQSEVVLRVKVEVQKINGGANG